MTERNNMPAQVHSSSCSRIDGLVLRRMQHAALSRWQKPQNTSQKDAAGESTTSLPGRSQTGPLTVSFASKPAIKVIQPATEFSGHLQRGDLWYTSSEFDEIEEDAEDTAMGENPFEDSRGLEMYEEGEGERLRQHRRQVTSSVLREQERLRESTGKQTVDSNLLAGVSTNLSMGCQDLAYRRGYHDELAARRRRSSEKSDSKNSMLKSITQFFRSKPSGQ